MTLIVTELDPVESPTSYQFENKEDMVESMDDIIALGFVPQLTPYNKAFPNPEHDPQNPDPQVPEFITVLVWRMTIASPDETIEAQHVYLTPPLQPEMQTHLIKDGGKMIAFTTADALLKYKVKTP